MAKNNKDVKRYKCMNFGACAKADSGEIIEIDALETIGGTPDCPHCHQHTLEEQIKKPFNWKPIAIAAAVIIVAGGCIVGGLRWKDNQQQQAIEQARMDSIAKAAEEAEIAVLEQARLDSIEQARRDSIEKARQDSIANAQKPTGHNPGPGTGPSTSTKNLGYATYKGQMKNDQPHGNGTLTFKTSHIIDSRDTKNRVAEAGDYVSGLFYEGHVETAKWYSASGNLKGSLILGRP